MARSSGMKCPVCGSETTVTRSTSDGFSVHRDRVCKDCLKVFSTYEAVIPNRVRVIKPRREAEYFNVSKLRRSIEVATKKLDISPGEQEEMVQRIAHNIVTAAGSKNEVTSRFIGEEVLKELNKKNDAALVRYASYYMYKENPSVFSDLKKEIMKKIS